MSGTVRSGMGDLIQRVRALGYAGTADYTAGTVAYFSDLQLQGLLDETRVNLQRVPLRYVSELDGLGAAEYLRADAYDPLDPDVRFGFIEQDAGTVRTAGFVIEDSFGSPLAASDYAVDWVTGRVTFTADQGGSSRYAWGSSYNPYLAAAEVWYQKAAAVAEGFDFKIQSHWIAGSQKLKQCLLMAREMERMGGRGATTTAVQREDME